MTQEVKGLLTEMESQRKKHWSGAAEQSLALTWAGNGSFPPVSVERPLNVTGIEWSPQ